MEENEWAACRAGTVTCRDKSSMPGLPLPHSHVLLMLSITGISANDPRLFTRVEYFSCGLESYTAPGNHFANGYREASEAGGVAPQSPAQPALNNEEQAHIPGSRNKTVGLS